MLPNRMCKRCWSVSTLVKITRPKPNIPENTTPITVSSFTRLDSFR
jgi:hypothetical protein